MHETPWRPGTEKVAVSTVARPFRATRAAGYVGGSCRRGLPSAPSTQRLGLFCPFRALTGWDCPLCGGTRMGAALLTATFCAFGFNLPCWWGW